MSFKSLVRTVIFLMPFLSQTVAPMSPVQPLSEAGSMAMPVADWKKKCSFSRPIRKLSVEVEAVVLHA